MGLPPELDRIGAALTHAAARKRTREERRRRITASIAAGMLVFAAMTPAPLDRADQPVSLPSFLRLVVTTNAVAAEPCDQPRGQHFDLEKTCGGDPAPRQAVVG